MTPAVRVPDEPTSYRPATAPTLRFGEILSSLLSAFRTILCKSQRTLAACRTRKLNDFSVYLVIGRETS